ncbi:hypothetical protein DFH09DRAFT_1099496 [Mycena vulgaris]|nr:hypothetical protein DFH09DRAFT_1099496 [Mycena vulgaris]
MSSKTSAHNQECRGSFEGDPDEIRPVEETMELRSGLRINGGNTSHLTPVHLGGGISLLRLDVRACACDPAGLLGVTLYETTELLPNTSRLYFTPHTSCCCEQHDDISRRPAFHLAHAATSPSANTTPKSGSVLVAKSKSGSLPAAGTYTMVPVPLHTLKEEVMDAQRRAHRDGAPCGRQRGAQCRLRIQVSRPQRDEIQLAGPLFPPFRRIRRDLQYCLVLLGSRATNLSVTPAHTSGSSLSAAQRRSQCRQFGYAEVQEGADADADTGVEPARSPVQEEGDRRLRRIARAGKRWKRTMGHTIDMEVYIYRLALEYAQLWADDCEAMAYKSRVSLLRPHVLNAFIVLVLVPVHVVNSRRPQLRLSRARVPLNMELGGNLYSMFITLWAEHAVERNFHLLACYVSMHTLPPGSIKGHHKSPQNMGSRWGRNGIGSRDDDDSLHSATEHYAVLHSTAQQPRGEKEIDSNFQHGLNALKALDGGIGR